VIETGENIIMATVKRGANRQVSEH